jgi:hypothetical protein
MRELDAAAADPRTEVVVDCAAFAHYMPFLDPRSRRRSW